jgi:hypothetical protein
MHTPRPYTGFPMSANLSWLRLFQQHLRSLVWVWVWVWDWIQWRTSPRTRSPSSLLPPFTQYSFSPCSLVCGGQTSPHKPRFLVSHSTCSPQSSSPHSHSFVLGTAVINNNTHVPVTVTHTLVRDGQTSPRLVFSRRTCPPLSPSPHMNRFVIGPQQ